MIFDVLAFRSDIGFWKGKETMSGLSSRAVISSAAQTVIIYLYLLDADNLNSIVLATYTFSTAVELWKVVRVLQILRASRARVAAAAQDAAAQAAAVSAAAREAATRPPTQPTRATGATRADAEGGAAAATLPHTALNTARDTALTAARIDEDGSSPPGTALLNTALITALTAARIDEDDSSPPGTAPRSAMPGTGTAAASMVDEAAPAVAQTRAAGAAAAAAQTRSAAAQTRAAAAARVRLEGATERFDEIATRTLGVGLAPLVGGWAIYALVYYPHTTWYSWVISSLADSVYLFGFVSMTPQLFINYKLKSVAHMPWRVMAYKAFNTFIDDAFALLVSMPLHHKIACLRDDVVFLVFLYQRYLYPVDKTRANEYGIAYEHEPGADATTALTFERELPGTAPVEEEHAEQTAGTTLDEEEPAEQPVARPAAGPAAAQAVAVTEDHAAACHSDSMGNSTDEEERDVPFDLFGGAVMGAAAEGKKPSPLLSEGHKTAALLHLNEICSDTFDEGEFGPWTFTNLSRDGDSWTLSFGNSEGSDSVTFSYAGDCVDDYDESSRVISDWFEQINSTILEWEQRQL